MAWTFDSVVFLWREEGNYHLVRLPEAVADDIDEQVPLKNGFGSVKVSVGIGTSRWQTSVFPSKEERTYVMFIKKVIREQEGITLGDKVTVTLDVLS